MRVIVGSDEKRSPARASIIEHMMASGVDCHDFGADTDYAAVAEGVAGAVATAQYDTGVLICRNGIGMSIAANKQQNIRAARCMNIEDAYDARHVNDANVIALGDIDAEQAHEILSVWLRTPFAKEERHRRSLATIQRMDAKNG